MTRKLLLLGCSSMRTGHTEISREISPAGETIKQGPNIATFSLGGWQRHGPFCYPTC